MLSVARWAAVAVSILERPESKTSLVQGSAGPGIVAASTNPRFESVDRVPPRRVGLCRRRRRRGRQDQHLPGRTLPAHRQTPRKLKALVAVARSILVIVWHLLTDSAARFHDLGSDYHTHHIDLERRMRDHIAQLTAMGYRVTLEPAAPSDRTRVTGCVTASRLDRHQAAVVDHLD